MLGNGGSDVAYIHSGKRNGDGTGQNFEKPRRGREKKQEEGTQLAPGRVVALSSNRPCARGPCFEGLLRVRELRAEKFNSARAARASESSDTERYFPSSARRSTASQKRNADQLANRKRDRRFRALGINIRRRRVRAIEKTQLTKPAPLFGIKAGAFVHEEYSQPRACVIYVVDHGGDKKRGY